MKLLIIKQKISYSSYPKIYILGNIINDYFFFVLSCFYINTGQIYVHNTFYILVKLSYYYY